MISCLISFMVIHPKTTSPEIVHHASLFTCLYSGLVEHR